MPLNNNTFFSFLLIYPCAKIVFSGIFTLVKFWVGINELNESRSTCFGFSLSLLRVCLTCLHPCRWAILVVSIVLFAHNLMHWVTHDKSHTFYSQINDQHQQQQGFKHIRPIRLFHLLFRGSRIEISPNLLRLVFRGVLHRHHLLDNSNQDKRIKLQQMRINHVNPILHQRFYFTYVLDRFYPFNYVIW